MELDKEVVEQMLAKCFELEGLLSLVKHREDNTPAQVYDMIGNSVSCLASMVESKSYKSADDEAIASAVRFEESSDADEPATHRAVKFSINDKFMFIRELFNGNDQDFTEAVSEMELMDNRDDIEDFLSNDLCLDLNDERVKQFEEAILNCIGNG